MPYNPNVPLSVEETAELWDMTVDEMLDEYGSDSVVPACCVEMCETEPDGHCEHGNPSILLELGLI